MKITFKTNNPSVVGNGKHDFKKRLKSKQLISKVVNTFAKKYDVTSLQEVVVYTTSQERPVLGSVNRAFNDNKPNTILNISDLVAGQLHFPQFYSFAYHNIDHEMCHIQDYETICKYMDGNLLSDYQCKSGLQNFYFDSGCKFFGEYIAYRNCFGSYSEQYPEYDLLKQEEVIVSVIQRLFEVYDGSLELKNVVFNKAIGDMFNSIYVLCKRIGYYHASHDKTFLKNIELIKSKEVASYISNLIEKLDNLYSNYPLWISYGKYIDIGKLFFSIFDGCDIELHECNDNICFNLKEKHKALAEQVAIANSKVKPPDDNSNSSDNGVSILEITRDNKPVKQEPEREL
jgi:hypothetical protein